MSATLIWAIAILAIGVTCLPLRAISEFSFARVRDWWLLGMLGLGTLACLWLAPPFVPIGVYLVCRWRSHRQLPTVVVWVGLAAFWIAVSHLSPLGWRVVRWGWVGVLAVAVPVMVWEYAVADKGRNPWWHPFRHLDTSRAWLGQRTLAGAFCALLLPFCPGWLLLLPVAGLYVTGSWTAQLGALAAACVLWPWIALPGAGVVLLVAACARWWPRVLWLTPRGQSLDSVRQRVWMWRLLGASIASPRWVPWGYGPRTMTKQIMVWAVRVGPANVTLGNAHMEPGQFLYEYGLLGLAALGWLGWLVVPHLRWQDPWSAAWIAGVVVSLGALPFRAVPTGLVWLAVSAYLGGRA